MDVEAKLKSYKKQIDAAKKELAQAEGSSNMVLRRLKEEYGISTIEDAKTRLGAISAERTALNNRIEERVKYIEDTYVME